MNVRDTGNQTEIRILQANLNASRNAQEELINAGYLEQYDIVAIQEPWLDWKHCTRAPTNWRVIYPTHHQRDKTKIKTRAVIFINRRIRTDTYQPISYNNSDVVAIRLLGRQKHMDIYNIYASGRNMNTIRQLAMTPITDRNYKLWIGDFNSHHPQWDEERNDHLFTPPALARAEVLIKMVKDRNMYQALPKDIPTLRAFRTGNLTRPDNIFLSEALGNSLVRCDARQEITPTCTDHFPIETIIRWNEDMTQEPTPRRRGFKQVDWEKFGEKLKDQLSHIPIPKRYATAAEIDKAVNDLTTSLQTVIEEVVPIPKTIPNAKRWWTKELREATKAKNQIRRQTIIYRHEPDHPSHYELKRANRRLAILIELTRDDYWKGWLRNAAEGDAWTAIKCVTTPYGDGSTANIPALTVKNAGQRTIIAQSNEAKGRELAKTFFPPPPPVRPTFDEDSYDEPVCAYKPITRAQIRRAISRAKPHKMPGMDGIPNIVYKKMIDQLIEYLYWIYEGVLRLKHYPQVWKDYITWVLRKPGRPDYTTCSAYRPIAFIRTMAKFLASAITETVMDITERHHTLPKRHFGGRPGHTTNDSLHYLVHKIMDAWRANKVVAVLFLDIEAAFPNALPEQLIHNMRLRGIPKEYTDYLTAAMEGRRTKMTFDDYSSEWIHINNGIDQGNPPSMVEYLYYNADLLDIPKNRNEDAIAFVDDANLIATAKTLEEAYDMLEDMMTRQGGGIEWASKHNSRFSIPKMAVVGFTRKKEPVPGGDKTRPITRPRLIINGEEVKTVEYQKSLGVILDQELKWHEQTAYVVKKGEDWIANFRRLSNMSDGLSPKHMSMIYRAVLIPKVTYGADVWYTETRKEEGRKRMVGSRRIEKKLQSIQRKATIAITGALRTTPTDLLDLHCDLPPIDLAMQQILRRKTLRMATLPDTHALTPMVKKVAKRKTMITTLPSPLHHLFHMTDIKPDEIETINPVRHAPHRDLPFQIQIDGSKELALETERNAREHIRVYADGSGLDGHIGAAAAIFIRGKDTKWLLYHLGTDREHIVYEGEAVGVLLGLHLLDDLSSNELEHEIVIAVDNQAILLSFAKRKADSGQHLVDEIIRLAEKLKKKAASKDFQLTLRWVPGHMDVQGNETVDELAKRAAHGESSDKTLLPVYLRKPLPQNSSAIWATKKKATRKQWKMRWTKAERFERMRNTDPNAPNDKFMKLAKGLRKGQTSMLVQLRTGHIPLNAYLHRFHLRDDPDCPHCPDESETVQHFLFDCPEYKWERHQLRRKLGRGANSMACLTGTKAGARQLLKYIESTGRFPTYRRLEGDIATQTA